MIVQKSVSFFAQLFLDPTVNYFINNLIHNIKMKITKFFAVLLSAAMLLTTATFISCGDDDEPDTPVNPVNPDDPKPDPEPTPTPTKADEIAETIKQLSENATDGAPVALELDAATTADDIKSVAEAINKSETVNVALDLTKTSLTAVPAEAFKEVKNLSEVVLSEKITSIGDNAFKGCKTLKTVDFAAPLTKSGTDGTFTIGAYAFADCAELDSVKVPTANLEIAPTAFEGTSIAVLADGRLIKFADAKYAENVFVLAHVTEIPDTAFYYAVAHANTKEDGSIDTTYTYNETLKTITFAEGSKLTRIGKSAFANCSSLYEGYNGNGKGKLETVVLPASIKEIDDYALCYGCKTLTLPANLDRIGKFACGGINMGDDFEIPSTIKEVDSLAFYWNTDSSDPLHVYVRTTDGKGTIAIIPKDIETFEIPNTWTEMPFLWGWWGNWPNLREITFQKDSHIELIRTYQFPAVFLEKIVIPASVKVIESYAFTGTNNTEMKIFFEEGSQIEKINPTAFGNLGWWHMAPEIHLPKFFELTNEWSETTLVVPDYVTIYCPKDLVEQFKAADCYKNCTIIGE